MFNDLFLCGVGNIAPHYVDVSRCFVHVHVYTVEENKISKVLRYRQTDYLGLPRNKNTRVNLEAWARKQRPVLVVSFVFQTRYQRRKKMPELCALCCHGTHIAWTIVKEERRRAIITRKVTITQIEETHLRNWKMDLESGGDTEISHNRLSEKKKVDPSASDSIFNISRDITGEWGNSSWRKIELPFMPGRPHTVLRKKNDKGNSIVWIIHKTYRLKFKVNSTYLPNPIYRASRPLTLFYG